MLIRLLSAALLSMIAAAPSRADPVSTQGAQQTALGLFNSAQELPAFTADQLAARRKLLDDDEAAEADAALNGWKLCVMDALVRWSVLKPGVGTLIDGAFGRCADLERDYRDHLMRIMQGGRSVVDVQMARGMTRLLEDVWRPRLIAAALDQELARQASSAPPPGTTPPSGIAPSSARPGAAAASAGAALRADGLSTKPPRHLP